MKTMCPPGYHNNGFVGNSTHALGHMITGRAHCFHDCIDITPILFL